MALYPPGPFSAQKKKNKTGTLLYAPENNRLMVRFLGKKRS